MPRHYRPSSDYDPRSENNPNYDYQVEPHIPYTLKLATEAEADAAWRGCQRAIRHWLAQVPPAQTPKRVKNS